MSKEAATSRMPVTPSTHERMKEFKNGLSAEFDDALIVLLDIAVQSGEDEYSAGKRLRDRLKQLKAADE